MDSRSNSELKLTSQHSFVTSSQRKSNLKVDVTQQSRLNSFRSFIIEKGKVTQEYYLQKSFHSFSFEMRRKEASRTCWVDTQRRNERLKWNLFDNQ